MGRIFTDGIVVALEVFNDDKAVSNLDYWVTLRDGGDLDKVLATSVLMQCIIGPNDDMPQWSTKKPLENSLILLDNGVKCDILHGMVVLYAL